MALWLLAFFACFLLLYAWQRRVRQLFVDHPNERSLHSTPVPRIGGLVMFPVFVVACLCLPSLPSPPGLAALVAAAGLWLLALLDDYRSVSAQWRLLVQILICLVLGGCYWQTGMVWWAIVCFVLYALAALNIYNFMDGSDGLAASQAMVGFAALGLAAVYWLPQTGLAEVAGLIVAVVAGFLMLNWSPARIFMGDAGSTLLGFAAAVMAFAFYQHDPGLLPVAVLPFAPFWLDGGLTLCKRIVRGERFWLPHRQHLYQRLILAGISHRAVAVAYGTASAACAVVGFACVLCSCVWPFVLLCLALGTVVARVEQWIAAQTDRGYPDV